MTDDPGRHQPHLPHQPTPPPAGLGTSPGPADPDGWSSSSSPPWDPQGEQQPPPPPGLTRRMVLLVVSAVVVAALIIGALSFPVPYVQLSPGPTENTLGAYDGVDVIVIEGEETYPTEGNLDLTTVLVTRADTRLSLWEAAKGWLDPSVAVVPRDQYYGGGVTQEQITQRNAEAMELSQQGAVVAALGHLDIPIENAVLVAAIVEGAPSLGVLKAGDVVLAVDGVEIADSAEAVELVRDREPGDVVEITVRRDDEQLDLEITTDESTPTDDDPEVHPIIGANLQQGFDLPFDVEITLGDSIGGPSAGLMFALGIVDKLTPGALTGGAYIAGTGTISAEGEVGPIGGIQQKIHGARDKGATVFLVPDENCPSALAADVDDITLVRVSTLDDAVTALETLDAGGTVPGCD